MNCLEKLLETVHTHNIILKGDNNIKVMTDSSSTCSQKYLDMSSHRPVKIVNIPTRQKSCIIQFMIKSLNKWQTFVFDKFTDHYLILLQIEKIIPFHHKLTKFNQKINLENTHRELENVA